MQIRVVSGCLLAAISLLATPTAHADATEPAPIVAIFDIQDHSGQLPATLLTQLKAYLRAKLAEGGVFQIVPEGELKQRLRQQKRDSFRACYDEQCQIELGRELAAQKSLSTQIAKVGGQCVVMSALYDLKRSTSERSASHKTGCSQAQLVVAIEKVAAVLRPKVAQPTRSPAVSTGGLLLRSEPSGAQVWIDGKRRGTTPATLLNLPAGSHKLRLVSRYHAHQGSIEVVADRLGEHKIALPLNAAGKARDRASQADRARVLAIRRRGSVWGYSVLGIGLTALATAGVLYGVGYSAIFGTKDRYDDAYRLDEINESHDEIARGTTMAYVGHGLAVGGTIAVIVAIKLLSSRPEAPTGPGTKTVAWGCSPMPGGAACGLGGRF